MIRRSVFRYFLLPLVAALAVAHGANTDRIGSYDFSYDSTGDARVRPVQVFDDGRNTFFQFRSGEAIPAIFIMSGSGPVLAMPEIQGPYVRINATAAGYLLRLGYGIGQVKYGGPGRAALPAQMLPQPTPNTMAQAQSATRLLAAAQQINGLPADMFNAPAPQPRLEVNSYATPIKGDKVEWSGGASTTYELGVPFRIDSKKLSPTSLKAIKGLAARAARATRVEIVGRDDPSHKDGTADARAEVVASVLAGAGVPRAVMAMKSTAQVKDQTNKSVEGVTIRLIEQPKAEPTAVASSSDARSEAAVMEIVRRLRSGELSPAGAAEMLERTRTAVPPAAAMPVPLTALAPRQWAMRKTDETVQKMLDRWAKDSGWRVVAEGSPTVPIVGDAVVDRLDFLQAADMVIKQAKAAGYHIKATAYSNQVLQIQGE
jgi:outer membrane protein OmpA-like peptidoglycan-associated protein